MKGLRRGGAWPGLFAAALAAATISAPASRSTAAAPVDAAAIHSLVSEGRYPAAAAAARALIEQLRQDGRARSDEAVRAWLGLAEANEREEGSSDATLGFLGEAQKAMPRSPSDPLLPVRLDEARALALARKGDGQAAADALLRASQALSRMRPPPAALEQLRLRHSYGVFLLRRGLYRESLVEFVAAFEGRDSALPAGHADTLESLHQLGEARFRLGDLDGAEETFREVARVRRLALGEDHPQTVESRSRLAAVWERKGLRQEALAERKALLELVQARGPGSGTVRALLALSEAHESLRQRDESLAAATRAFELSLAAEPRHPVAVAEAGAHLAKLHHARGAFGDSIAVGQKAAEASGLPDHHVNAIDLQVTRAAAYVGLGRLPEAELVYRRLIAIYDAAAPLYRGGRIAVLNNYAALLGATRRPAQAIPLQREVVEFRTRVLGVDDPLTLAAMSSLASFLGASGDAKAGIEMHRRVLSRREAAWPQDVLAIASSLHNLGSALETENPGEAIKLLRRAADIRARSLGPSHPDTIVSMRQLAGFLFESGNASAAALYEKVAAAVEDGRFTAAATEAQRRTYFSTAVEAYKMLAILKAQSGQGAAAMAYADAARARTLSEQVGSRDIARSLLSADEAARLAEAEEGVARLAGADLSAMSPEERLRHGGRLDSAAAALAQVRQVLMAAHPQLRFAAKAEPLTLKDVQAAIPVDAAFIQFVVLGDKVQTLWLTADGRGGGSAVMSAPALGETVRAYLAILSEPAAKPPPGSAVADRRVFAWPDGSFRLLPLTAEIPEGAEILGDPAPVRAALSRILVESLPERIRALPRWIVSPDSFLAALPFDSLELGGKLLLETKGISYVPSFRTLVLLGTRQAAYRKLARAPLLVVGDPAYQSAGQGSPAKSWQELAGSKLEVQAMQAQFGLEPDRSLFSRLTASERTVRELDSRQRLTQFRTLLFSTHGIVDMGTPERNAIILVGDGAGPESDGYLTAAEISSLNLRSDLVVVSACESGVGEWLDGEGAMGLPYALFVAGTASAVLSHWPIADRGSAAFMARFFRKMQAGARPAQALQQTKLDFWNGLEGERWRDPAYWAAFSLYGSPT